MKNQVFRPSNTQSGSIFVWIFVMIALFGALSFAMMQSSRTGAGSISKEKARLVAQEIVQAGTEIRTAVKILQLDGCADTEISFNGGPTEGDYTNPNAPADGHCDVFGNNGAKLRAPEFGDNWGNERLFFGGNQVASLDNSAQYGTTALDLTMVRQVSQEVCGEINLLLGNKARYWESSAGNKYLMWESMFTHSGSRNVLDDNWNILEPFQGDYDALTVSHIVPNPNMDFNGQSLPEELPPKMGCFCDSYAECDPPSKYYFYTVLIAR